MTLADILFTQGFGTRYDCRQIVLSGAVSVNGRVADGTLLALARLSSIGWLSLMARRRMACMRKSADCNE